MSSELEDIAADQGTSNKPLFETVNALDPRLHVKDSLVFAVEKSAANVTQYTASASSASTSGLSFSLITPSLSTIISRHILLSTRVTFTVQVAQAVNAALPCREGVNMCIAPFAAHQMMNNMTLSFNGFSFTQETRDVLNPLLRSLDPSTLENYVDFSGSMLDNYQRYKDIGNYYNTTAIVNADYSLPQPANSVFNDYASNFKNDKSRGSYVIESVTYYDDAAPNVPLDITQPGTNVAAAARTLNVKIVARFVEPILMSPCLLGPSHGSSQQGLYGINNISATMTLNSSNPRSLRFMEDNLNTYNFCNITTVNATDANLYFTFLSPHPSLRLSARNLCPILDTRIYKQEFSTVKLTGAAGSTLTETMLPSQSYQLQCIPDSVIIGVRPVNRNYMMADWYLPITNVSITFANSCGILSTATQHQLYLMSKEEGLTCDWPTFQGYANKAPILAAGGAVTRPGEVIATAGSPIKLSFGRHINLQAEYASPSLIGTFSFQVNVTVQDNTYVVGDRNPNATIGNMELFLIFMSSGILINSTGSSSSYIGLVTKQNVIEASQKPEVDTDAYGRWYGKGYGSDLKAGIKYNASKYMDESKGSGYSAGGFSGGSKNSKLKNRTY